MSRVALLVIGMGLMLGSCGSREELVPPKGQMLPVKPAAARETPSADDLLKPPSQTRPERSDTLIESSKERRDDEFDLPPTSR